MRSRAQINATSVLVEAVSWMTPLHAGERPTICRTQAHDHLFQLAQGGARLPREAEHAQAGAEEVPQDGGQRAVGGEVAEEARVLPVREAGQDGRVDVAEDVGEGLGIVGRLGRERGADGARLGAGHDGERLDPAR